MKQSSWKQIEQRLADFQAALQKGWGLTLPPPTLPTEQMDRDVDHWCRVLANFPGALVDAPEPVRPWIHARLLLAAALAASLARSGRTDAPPLESNTLEHLLIGEWHGALRAKWPRVQPPS